MDIDEIYLELKFHGHTFRLPEELARAALIGMREPSENDSLECIEALEALIVKDGNIDLRSLENMTPQQHQRLIGLVVTIVAGGISQWPVEEVVPPRGMMH